MLHSCTLHLRQTATETAQGNAVCFVTDTEATKVGFADGVVACSSGSKLSRVFAAEAPDT